MMRISLTLTILILSLSFCAVNKKSTAPNFKEAQAILQADYTRILALTNSEPCTDNTDWLITPIGKKACGGPQSYMAYAVNIDTVYFLEQVAVYTEAENDFNIAWDIISNCAVTPQPSSVICENGKAVLVY